MPKVFKPRKTRNSNKQQTFFSCQICFEDFTQRILVDVGTCNEQHLFCPSCTFEHFKSDLKQSQIPERCPGINRIGTGPAQKCPNTYNYTTVRFVLESFGQSREESKNLVETLDNLLLRNSLKSDPTWIFCPRASCIVGGNDVGTCGGKEILSCQTCKTTFCSECLRDHALDKECPKDSSEETKLSEAWTTVHAKKCPSCKCPINKYIGCDHITCVNCKYEFCYLCMGSYYVKFFSLGSNLKRLDIYRKLMDKWLHWHYVISVEFQSLLIFPSAMNKPNVL